MSDDEPVTVNRNRSNLRKMRDSAALLPLLGLLVFVTPLITLFTSSQETTQLPRSMLYVFGVWFLLIILAFLLSKAIGNSDEID
jgi:hypothetical protein